MAKNLLVTYHPETIKNSENETDVDEMLLALNEFEDINLILTMPNADVGNKKIIQKIQKFTQLRKNASL